MTDKWRLVSDAGKDGTPKHQLFDIEADPGQENDVIIDHSDVAERLKGFYNEWWKELEPTFGSPCPHQNRSRSREPQPTHQP